MKKILWSCLISSMTICGTVSIEQLQQAIEYNDPVLVLSLIKQGVDVNTRLHTGSTVLIDIVGSGFKDELLHPDQPDCLCGVDEARDCDKAWYMHYNQLRAIRRAIIMQLLNAGSDVNACDEDGRTALHRACIFGDDIELICLLLAAGAKPNVADRQGYTPLDSARGVENRIHRKRLLDLLSEYAA